MHPSVPALAQRLIAIRVHDITTRRGGARQLPGRVRELVRDGELCGDEGAALRRALDAEPPVQGGNPVAQTQKTAPVGPGAADAVVAHGDREHGVLDVRADAGAPGLSMFCDVGQRLGYDEVSGRFDLGRQPTDGDVDVDRHRGSRSQGPNSRTEPVRGED